MAIPVILENFAKRIYIDHALRRIRKIDERNLSSEERDAQIERAGGASIPDAVFASIIFISLMMLSILAQQ